MAVKVIVCGDNSGDYEFVVATVDKKRLFNEEILELLDEEGVLLYTVPVHSLRLIQILPEDIEDPVKPQKFQPNNSITSVCINNAGGNDAQIECTRVNGARFINETVIETLNFLGTDNQGNEKWFNEFVIPLKQIKFINHNHVLPEPVKNNTKETSEESIAVEENSETQEELKNKPAKKQHRRFVK